MCEIQDDIVELYGKLMKEQEKVKGSNLCTGGNMGKALAAYTIVKYGKGISFEDLSKILQ